MKILLDECVTKKIKPFLAEHTVFTIGQMDWQGLKNGMLLKRAVDKDFDIFYHRQKHLLSANTVKHNIAIVVLNVNDSNIETIREFVPNFIRQINNFEKGKLYFVEKQNRQDA